MNTSFGHSTRAEKFLAIQSFGNFCTIDGILYILKLYIRICFSRPIYTCPCQMIEYIIFVYWNFCQKLIDIINTRLQTSETRTLFQP